jgi:thioredoxin 1
MSVIELSDNSDLLNKLSEAGSRLVVVDFFSPQCPPCKQIAPFYAQLATKNPNVMFLKGDVDKRPEFMNSYGFTSVPMFIFYRNRNELERVRGANNQALESKLKLLSESIAQTDYSGPEQKPAVNKVNEVNVS